METVLVKKILCTPLNNAERVESIMSSTKRWFRIWANIIKEKKEINRVDLADLSGCSLWTLKSLQKDFILSEAYILYRNGKFVYWTPRIESTLSTLSESDREELK